MNRATIDMGKNEEEEEKKPGTMQDYVWRLLKRKEQELFAIPLADLSLREKFHRVSGQVDMLYMILTGHNNPLSNPKDE